MSMDHEIDPPQSPVEEIDDRLQECREALANASGELEVAELQGRIAAYDDARDIFTRSRWM